MIVGIVCNVHTEQANYTGARETLDRMGVDIETIFLTHLHIDHTSGVEDFDDSVRVVVASEEFSFMGNALLGSHLSGKRIHDLSFMEAQDMPPFGPSIDVFNDGSFWAISTPGHSAGHVSFLVNGTTGPVFLSGDAVAYIDQLDFRLRPSSSVANPENAVDSLDRIQAFLRQFPETTLYTGHDDISE